MCPKVYAADLAPGQGNGSADDDGADNDTVVAGLCVDVQTKLKVGYPSLWPSIKHKQ